MNFTEVNATQKKISIGLPVFNGEQFIRKKLELNRKHYYYNHIPFTQLRQWPSVPAGRRVSPQSAS